MKIHALQHMAATAETMLATIADLTPGAWSLIPYGLRDEIRYVWNASPYAPPAALALCDRGFVWQRRARPTYLAQLYVPRGGETLLMFDGFRLVAVKADLTLVGIYSEICARGELGRIVLAPSSARRVP